MKDEGHSTCVQQCTRLKFKKRFQTRLLIVEIRVEITETLFNGIITCKQLQVKQKKTQKGSIYKCECETRSDAIAHR